MKPHRDQCRKSLQSPYSIYIIVSVFMVVASVINSIPLSIPLFRTSEHKVTTIKQIKQIVLIKTALCKIIGVGREESAIKNLVSLRSVKVPLNIKREGADQSSWEREFHKYGSHH